MRPILPLILPLTTRQRRVLDGPALVSKPAATAAFGTSRLYAAWHVALFKTGAFNRSATHPARNAVEELVKRHCSMACFGRERVRKTGTLTRTFSSAT